MDTRIINLRENWKFHLEECEEAWYRGYRDNAWKTVEIPHDWAVEGNFEKIHSSGTGYLPGGIGWYRVRFTLPEEYRGKRVRLCFDGVYILCKQACRSEHCNHNGCEDFDFVHSYILH
jgi:beta-galactosidase/beta-glucuronidase